MQFALSLALIVSLVAPAVPVTAQDETAATAGPLARTATREAVRLAREVRLKPDATDVAAGELATFVVETVQQSRKPARSHWLRVLKVAPGTEVIVTVRGSHV